jgi:uncharacterized protein|tara:strand:+ start:239 stop:745 length:507 start_codon:yes stop_codon:yes gene_type:complete
MQIKLHRLYQYQKEASQRSYHEGLITLVELSRLTAMLKSDQAEISVQFCISDSDYDQQVVKGHIEAELSIECQRCLKPVVQPVHLDFELLINAPDHVVQNSGLDTLYSEDGMIDIFEVVEDELILGLPLVALHENGSCNEYWQISDNVQEKAKRENPFLVLEKLKTKH